MITMEDWVTIKNLSKKGKSKREIAKLLGISRNTVKRTLQNDVPPEYIRKTVINQSLAPFTEAIEEGIWVKHFLGSRIFNDIVSKGYTGSRTAFYRYLQKVTAPHVKTFMPYETGPSEQAQFDWSEYSVTLDKQLIKIYIFTYILSFSRFRVYEPSLSQTQSAILEALENGFIQTGGVVQRVQTDNAGSFVTNASKNNFQWNLRYLNFCGHFGFEPTRSLPAHPWSKGKVENPFYYLEEHFIKGNEFESFEDFSLRLKQFQREVNQKIHTTTRVAPEQLYEKEKLSLIPLPQSRYVGIHEQARKVTADCLISFDGNKYSVPYFLAGREVWVKVSKGYTLQIYSSANQLVASHTLSAKKGAVILIESHYKNHQIERGSWNRLCETFTERFAAYSWFVEKLKTQKRINPAYHLTQILYIADFYQPQDVFNAFEMARQYNVYTYVFIKGYLEKHATPDWEFSGKNVPALSASAAALSHPSVCDIKRPLTQYNIFPA